MSITVPALLGVYCVGIIVASLLGGLLPAVFRFTHTWMQVTISLVGGLMLGVGLLHLLPHGIVEIQQVGGKTGADAVNLAVIWALVGLLVMFFLIRAFHFHQHDTAECFEGIEAGEESSGSTDAEHDHSSSGAQAVSTPDEDVKEVVCEGHPGHFASAHHLSWVGMAAGLSLHTLIDGLALGAAVKAGADHAGGIGPAGLAVFLAICLHKPLDSMSITTLMRAGGRSTRTCLLVNAAFAMMCPAGVLLLYFGASSMVADTHLLVGCALGFSAGVFLCISLGDLLPELQFHSHDRTKLSAALLIGVLLAWGIGFLEPDHAHHGPRPAESLNHVEDSRQSAHPHHEADHPPHD